MISFKNNDQKFINLALNLAHRNIGSTSSNPIVACVIVKDDNILATGITSINGRPHAEINAINKIQDKTILKNATLYVTLEPCSHYGETAPCVDEIILHKFSRVVICLKDPDLRVNGKGIELLKNARIEVVLGVNEDSASEINHAFLKSKIENKPYITIKIATSLDGKIATKNFDSKWITNEHSRKFSHFLRAKNQAIMVGAKTIIRDNPELNCRIEGLENYSPTKIIISNKLNFTFSENVFVKNSNLPTIILCGKENIENKKLQNWLNLNPNNQAIFCKSSGKKIDLNDALNKLNKSGINSILIEGGQTIITQFIQQNLIDELIWIRSNKIIGNEGVSAIGDLGIESINEVIKNFHLTKISKFENDILEIYKTSRVNI